jgi:hypothetical protein
MSVGYEGWKLYYDGVVGFGMGVPNKNNSFLLGFMVEYFC